MTINTTPINIDTVLIRPADQYDTDTVYKFLCELENEKIDKTQFEAIFARNLTDSQIHYLVAETAEKVVGFVSCHVQYLLHHAGKVGEIQELFIDPVYRNQQIGQRFIHALDEIAVQEGLVHLEVTTNQNRPDAIRFYERQSFRRTHYKLVKLV